MADQADIAEVEITPTMITAGIRALAAHCPMDIAFRVGGERQAVEAVLIAGLRAFGVNTNRLAPLLCGCQMSWTSRFRRGRRVLSM